MDPPAPAPCLIRPYSASADQKGGTLIRADIEDLETHEALVCDPDGYRPEVCATCGCRRLHAHDFRYRKLGSSGEVKFRRYRCQGCRGVWMVLGAFVARCLHRRWETMRKAVEGEDDTVPRRTVRRWVARLKSAAVMVVQLLAEADPGLELDISWTRGELVDGLVDIGRLVADQALAKLAAWLHRLKPGVRLI